MDNLHSCIVKVHLIILASFSTMNTLGPNFQNLVFPFSLSKSELKIMFHYLLTFINECVIFSITSIVVSSASYVHVFFVHVHSTKLLVFYYLMQAQGPICL
jgi:hypothetical protein